MSALQFSFLGYAIRMAKPEYLFGLAAMLLVLVLAVVGALRRHRRLGEIFQAPTLPRVVPGASALRHGLKDGCTALALGLFALALAQPQCGTHKELAKRYGIDLVVALDASNSMLAKDIKPSRLERAKLELGSLLDRLHGDRVGIVVFAGDAFTQCPLTTDYASAKMFLRAIDSANMPVQGTSIARALEESKDLLVDAERGAKARAIVVLTDGEDTAASDVAAQVDVLKGLGIKVITVGIGSLTGEPIPEFDKKGDPVGWKKDGAGNTVMSRLDETGLQALADKTGGRYIHSVSGGVGVQEVWEELDRLDKAEFESRLTVKYDERFQYFALPGLLLLLVGAAIRPGRSSKEGRA
ncbi:MAG TPA: VWA domain-containing protein [Myxococcales bacterium]|jgi:Ca-activated chloride channel family protein